MILLPLGLRVLLVVTTVTAITATAVAAAATSSISTTTTTTTAAATAPTGTIAVYTPLTKRLDVLDFFFVPPEASASLSAAVGAVLGLATNIVKK